MIPHFTSAERASLLLPSMARAIHARARIRTARVWLCERVLGAHAVHLFL